MSGPIKIHTISLTYWNSSKLLVKFIAMSRYHFTSRLLHSLILNIFHAGSLMVINITKVHDATTCLGIVLRWHVNINQILWL